MVLDVLLAIVIVAGFYYGYQKGIVNTVFSILGFVLGTLILTKFNEKMTVYLSHHTSISPVYLPVFSILCLIIFIALFFKLMSWSSEQLLKTFHLTSVNKIIGGALFTTLVLFLFSSLLWYADQGHYIESETKEKSVSYSFVQPLSPVFTNAVGSAIPAFKDMYSNMSMEMDSLKMKQPANQ